MLQKVFLTLCKSVRDARNLELIGTVESFPVDPVYVFWVVTIN